MKGLLVSFFIVVMLQTAYGQQQNSTTNMLISIDSTVVIHQSILQKLLDSNLFLNSKATPTSYKIIEKKKSKIEVFFYLIAFLFLILGVVRTVFSRYFNTLFRVFFNTSLRQNQLTDQLEQAKLPSLIFNCFFLITSGIYIYFLINFFTKATNHFNLLLMITCIAAIGISYLVKYLSIKFTGWITQYESEAKTYIFIIFLVNKVLGVFLLPIIAILAFNKNEVVTYTILFSFIGLSVLFVIRFFRSFSLLQQRLKVSSFHFFMYIVALEILPLLLIYKTVMIYLGKNM